jgi:predicted dehydrogenase
MNKASMRTGMPLYVAYYRRFLPYFIKVKEILESDQLGTLLYTQVDFQVSPRPDDFNANSLPWRVLPEIAGAGYFYDLACHQLDLFAWFFGKTAWASGKSYNRRGLYKAEDLVFAQVVYESGLPLTGQWCFVADENQHADKIRVFGTKAVLEFSTFDFTPIKLVKTDGIAEFLPPNPENIQYWFIRNMVEELQGLRPKTCNGESASQTNWIMDKILTRINHENCC